MNSVNFRELAAATPTPYTPEQLGPLLKELDLNGATTAEYNLIMTVSAFALLGKAALLHDDVGTYTHWANQATNFVDDIHLRDSQEILSPDSLQSGRQVSAQNYFKYITPMHFLGAMQGHTESAAWLDGVLAGPNRKEPLKTTVKLCAQFNIAPVEWIERYAQNPDEYATVWGTYLSQKRLELTRQGILDTTDVLREPGTERLLQSALSGDLAAETIMHQGDILYHLCQSPDEKHALLSLYQQAHAELSTTHQETDYQQKLALVFAANVTIDQDIPQKLKDDLCGQISADTLASRLDNGQWWGALMLAQSIEANKNVGDILLDIEILVSSVNYSYSKNTLRDQLLGRAAALYAKKGRLEHAAVMASQISGTTEWEFATQLYWRHGGDPNYLLLADEIRQINYVPSLDAQTLDVADWTKRQQIMFLLKGITENDRNNSEAAIRQMVQARKSSEAKISISDINNYLGQLLVASPISAASVAPEIAAHAPALRDPLPTHELLSKYGSTDLAEVNWEIAHRQYENAADNSTFFHTYARMALASATSRLHQ